MPFLAPDIGIDLGTENINVYVRGRGIVISEPTLVVLDRENRHTVKAVGDEARFLYGRSPDQLIAVAPIRNGQVADFDIAELMFRYFIRKAVGVSYLGKPRIIISIPCGMDDVNRKALMEAIRMAGARRVFLIEKPFASAIGTGLPVYDPIGSLVVDIGAGTTDVAVISLGGLVVSQSIQVGGNKFNEAITEYLRKECNILIGNQTAENIKKDLARDIQCLKLAVAVTVKSREIQASLDIKARKLVLAQEQTSQPGSHAYVERLYLIVVKMDIVDPVTSRKIQSGKLVVACIHGYQLL